MLDRIMLPLSRSVRALDPDIEPDDYEDDEDEDEEDDEEDEQDEEDEGYDGNGEKWYVARP